MQASEGFHSGNINARLSKHRTTPQLHTLRASHTSASLDQTCTWAFFQEAMTSPCSRFVHWPLSKCAVCSRCAIKSKRERIIVIDAREHVCAGVFAWHLLCSLVGGANSIGSVQSNGRLDAQSAIVASASEQWQCAKPHTQCEQHESVALENATRKLAR